MQALLSFCLQLGSTGNSRLGLALADRHPAAALLLLRLAGR